MAQQLSICIGQVAPPFLAEALNLRSFQFSYCICILNHAQTMFYNLFYRKHDDVDASRNNSNTNSDDIATSVSVAFNAVCCTVFHQRNEKKLK